MAQYNILIKNKSATNEKTKNQRTGFLPGVTVGMRLCEI